MRAVSIVALTLVAGVLGAPSLSIRAEGWKTEPGWDGKTTTPAELDPSNVVKPTPGVSLSAQYLKCTRIYLQEPKHQSLSHP